MRLPGTQMLELDKDSTYALLAEALDSVLAFDRRECKIVVTQVEKNGEEGLSIRYKMEKRADGTE